MPLLCCLGIFSVTALRADPAGPVSSLPPAIAATSQQIDPEDRMMAGDLSPEAEAKSRANALYAEAMLQLEDPAPNLQEALAQLRHDGA